MNKKRVIAIVLLFTFLIISFMNFIIVYQFSTNFYGITGRASTGGTISLTILSNLDIDIVFPENASVYDYNLSDRLGLVGTPEYLVGFSVTNSSTIYRWYYSLYNPAYGEYYENVSFSPSIITPAVSNGTVPARAGWNFLTISVYNFNGQSINDSVWFYVNVSSMAPIINLDPDQIIYACEGSTLDYPFNVTDYDDLEEVLDFSISNPDPFFVYTHSLGRYSPGIFRDLITTYGFPLSYFHIGNHPQTISVNDGVFSDSRNISIEVLEVNDLPTVSNIPNDQIWTQGENTRFFFDVNASDPEDGSLSNFVLSYQNGSSFDLFSIDGEGVINYTANSSSHLGNYNLQVCVNDTPLEASKIHENLSIYCGSDGGVNTVCDNFTLVVTNDNRDPVFINKTINETLSVYNYEEINISADDEYIFSAYVKDEDGGFIDFNWSLNFSEMQSETSLFDGDYVYGDEFSYSFYCSVSGKYYLTVNASDGLAYVSHTWILNVIPAGCGGEEHPSGGGGGGGGSSDIICLENWYCDSYILCTNLEKGFANSLLNIKEYYDFYDMCRQMGLNELTCGFEYQKCVDFNSCNNTEFLVPKPNVTKGVCHYVVDPSCFDGIENCHDGSCEVLVDCGGPCRECPSCFDGILNQGEQGIDCSGPCPNPCESEEPLNQNYFALVMSLIVAFILILLIFYALYRLWRLLFVIWKRRNRDEELEGGRSEKMFSGKSRKKRIKSLLHDAEGGEE